LDDVNSFPNLETVLEVSGVVHVNFGIVFCLFEQNHNKLW